MKEVIRVDIKDNQPSGKSEDNVLDRTFPYAKFMDKSLVTPAVLDHIRNDPDGVVGRFQWVGRMLKKATTILRCSEPTVSIGLQVSKKVKDLGENIRLLKVEKFALGEAKQKPTSDIKELKEASPSKDWHLEEKDWQLEEARNRISELEKSNAGASGEIALLKAHIDFIENQQRKSAFEIKPNILAQCQVICSGADFGEVGLDKHVVDRRIEITPVSEDGDNLGNEPTTPATDPQD